MSDRQRGLGRGLSALLGEAATEVPVAAPEAAPEAGVTPEAGTSSGIREAPIEWLHRNPDQPRRVFTDTEIDELAASIREKGVLQPILVRPHPELADEYQIVAGERRWRAAQKAGLRAIPIIIRTLDDLEVLEIGIVENVQRADLNAIEEAMAYKALMDRFGRTQDAVAQVVGKSRSHVANMLRLLSLPDDVRDHVLYSRLSAGHARAVANAPDPSALAEKIVSDGLSVRQAEALARDAVNRPAPKSAKPRPEPEKSADTLALEQDLAEILGMAITLDDRGGSGELKITYESLEQLDELCRRLMRG